MQDAHISAWLDEIHHALREIVSAINRPARDERLLAEAGVKLEQPLFPLLVGVWHCGPVGVVELADRLGRNYTTVSRQLAKLEKLGLIERCAAADRRVHQVALSAKGRKVADRLDVARRTISRSVFATWDEPEIETFARLMRKASDGLREQAGDSMRTSGDQPPGG